jgi:hypothetical protein
VQSGAVNECNNKRWGGGGGLRGDVERWRVIYRVSFPVYYVLLLYESFFIPWCGQTFA